MESITDGKGAGGVGFWEGPLAVRSGHLFRWQAPSASGVPAHCHLSQFPLGVLLSQMGRRNCERWHVPPGATFYGTLSRFSRARSEDLGPSHLCSGRAKPPRGLPSPPSGATPSPPQGPILRRATMVWRWWSRWRVSASSAGRPGVPGVVFDLMLRDVMGARSLWEHCPGSPWGCTRRHPMPIAVGCGTGRAVHVLLLKRVDDCGAIRGEVREGQSTGRAIGEVAGNRMRRPATHSGGRHLTFRDSSHRRARRKRTAFPCGPLPVRMETDAGAQEHSVPIAPEVSKPPPTVPQPRGKVNPWPWPGGSEARRAGEGEGWPYGHFTFQGVARPRRGRATHSGGRRPRRVGASCCDRGATRHCGVSPGGGACDVPPARLGAALVETPH